MGSEFKWVAGSLGAVIVFGAGLLIYGIISSMPAPPPPKPTLDESSGSIIKIDSWECVTGQDARGSMYQYSKNKRNGASGPASLACKKE